MAHGEVVLHRVGRIERAQGTRDVERHRPARARVLRELQAAADADDVRIERHDEARGRHAGPDAEIERILPHHPPHEQVQPLAGAAGRRAREEIADERSGRHAAVGRAQVERHRPLREAIERVPHIVAAWVAFDEEPLQRTVRREYLMHQPEQRDDVRASNPAVHELAERFAVARRLEVAHELHGRAAHQRHDPLDRVHHAADPAKRQARGDERHNFPVVARGKPAHDLDRVGGGIGLVEALVEPVQRRLQRVRARISNLQSLISNLDSRISNQQSAISNKQFRGLSL